MLNRKIHRELLARIVAPSSLVFILFMTAFISGWSQQEVLDVKTYVSQDGVHPGGVIDIAFLLDILPGWHINGPELADPYLISCALLVDEDDKVEVKEVYYPEPETRSYGFSEVDLQVYEGKVVFGARIKVSDAIALGEFVLNASLLYQACDEASCLPPETLKFEVPFQVVPAAQQIKRINEEIFKQIEFR
jgi:DsbC/DsbD-like thiol-disulfide interchange protein